MGCFFCERREQVIGAQGIPLFAKSTVGKCNVGFWKERTWVRCKCIFGLECWWWSRVCCAGFARGER